MKHRSHKAKFGGGIDANSMLMRKMAYNFFVHGKLTTTEKKGQALRRYVEPLVGKLKDKTEANKNILLKHFGSIEFVNRLYTQVSDHFKDQAGGYTRVERLQPRLSDGASVVRVTWSRPFVIEVEKPKKSPKKRTKTKTEVKEIKAK